MNIPLCSSVLCASVSLREFPRRCSAFLGVPRYCCVPRCSSVLLGGVVRSSSVLLGVAWCSSMFLGFARCCSVLLGAARCSSVFLGVARCCSVLLALELFGVARCCGFFQCFLVLLGVLSVLLCGWEPPSVRLGVFG